MRRVATPKAPVRVRTWLLSRIQAHRSSQEWTPTCRLGERRFKSGMGRQSGCSSMVEHKPATLETTGSIPAFRSSCDHSSMAELLASNQTTMGSIPPPSATDFAITAATSRRAGEEARRIAIRPLP